MSKDAVANLIMYASFALSASFLLYSVVMLWRGRREARRLRHESRVHQRISELRARDAEARLSPEERARREAVRRQEAALRARAEAELAAEDAQRGRRRWPWTPTPR
jgi:Flp pilus assembly protein TadB